MSLFLVVVLVWLASAMLVIVVGLSISTRPASDRALKARTLGSAVRGLTRR